MSPEEAIETEQSQMTRISESRIEVKRTQIPPVEAGGNVQRHAPVAYENGRSGAGIVAKPMHMPLRFESDVMHELRIYA